MRLATSLFVRDRLAFVVRIVVVRCERAVRVLRGRAGREQHVDTARGRRARKIIIIVVVWREHCDAIFVCVFERVNELVCSGALLRVQYVRSVKIATLLANSWLN